MTALIKHQMNCASRIIQPKILYVGILVALGMQAAPLTAKAAFFEGVDKGAEPKSLLQSPAEIGGGGMIEGMDNIKELIDLENTYNKEAVRLSKQGLENFRSGDKQQGLKELQEAWALEPRLVIVGVTLSLNYIQNKEYEQALTIAKKIQAAITQDNYGLGYTMEGMVYAAKNELDKAEIAFKKAVRVMPNEKNSLLNLAVLTEAKKNYNDAKNYLQKLIDIESTNLQALERLANIEFVQGNSEKSVALLNKAISTNPGVASPIVALAKNYLKMGSYQQVLALTENKNDAAILEMRGKAYLALGDKEKAKQIFDKIVEQLPQSAPANYLLADFFANTGNVPETTKEIQNTLKKDPKFLPARIGEIKALFYSGKTPEAESASEALLKEFGNQQEVLSIAGWLAMHQNKYAQAEKYFEQMAKDNLNTEVVLWWVGSLWEQKKHDRGFAIIKDWIKNHPDDIRVQMALADGYMGLQKKAEAKEAYLKLIKMEPKLASAYNNLAWLVQEADLKQAIGYAETALSIEKENPQLLDTLGMLLVKDGQIDKGTALLQDAVKKSPDNIELMYHLAEVLVMQNKNTEAAPVLDKLVKTDLNEVMKQRVKALQAKATK